MARPSPGLGSDLCHYLIDSRRTDTLKARLNNRRKTSQGGGMSKASASRSGRLGFPKVTFVPWLSQPNYFKIDTCCFLVQCLSLLGYCKDWLAQNQDNETEWDSRSCCQMPDVPVRQHYKVAVIVHCHKSVPTPLPLSLSHNCEAQLHT